MTGDPTGAPLTGLPVSPQVSSAESDQTRRTKITLSVQNGHRGLRRMDHKSDKASWVEQPLNFGASPSATTELTTETCPAVRFRPGRAKSPVPGVSTARLRPGVVGYYRTRYRYLRGDQVPPRASDLTRPGCR